MEQVHFEGGIPEAYEACLHTLLFQPYAKWLAARLEYPPGIRILELAAGTGALTRELVPRLPPDATCVVTDLQEAMLAVAKRVVPERGCARCEVADAQDLPFDDASFDLVLCQFGWMFFPDKAAAAREASRVLDDDGRFGFLVWHPVENNEVAAIAKRVIGSFLPDGPPRGFDVPYGFADHTSLLSDLGESFAAVSFEDVSLVGHSNPEDAARGYCRGTPMALEIAARIPDKHAAVQAAMAEAYAARFGNRPFETELNAVYVEARV